MVNTDKADPFVLSGTQQGRWGRLGKLFGGMRGQIVEDFRFGNKFEHDGHSQFISPGGTKNLVEYTVRTVGGDERVSRNGVSANDKMGLADPSDWTRSLFKLFGGSCQVSSPRAQMISTLFQGT